MHAEKEKKRYQDLKGKYDRAEEKMLDLSKRLRAAQAEHGKLAVKLQEAYVAYSRAAARSHP